MNSDFEFAKKLQDQLNKQFQAPAAKSPVKKLPSSSNSDLDATQNLIHPEWEIIDPTPNVHILKEQYDKKFFQGKLAAVELEWSKQMYKCAGICYQRQNRFGYKSCTIRLSEPLLKLRPRSDLVQTLLHEMIHAYLFVLNIREGNGGHGPNFQKLMHGINRQAGTNITVYHTFHDEVEVYQRHWWRCNGPCQKRAPYFGYVKRAVNRAPGPYDFWYAKHQETCGGAFLKIKEPTPKKKMTKNKSPAKATKVQTNKISNYIKTGVNRGGNTVVITKPPVARQIFNDPPSKGSGNAIENPANSKIPPLTGNLKNVVGFKDLGNESNPNTRPVPLIPLFSGTGKTLGGSSKDTSSNAKRSRLLDHFDKTSKKPKVMTSPIQLSDEDDNIILAVDLDAIEAENTSKNKDPRKSETELRQATIKQEIMNTNGFSNDDEIILIDDDYDDNFVADGNVADDLNLSVEVLDDLFGEDTLTKEDTHRKPCVICWKKIRNSEHEGHVEKCYEEFMKQNEVPVSQNDSKSVNESKDKPSSSQSSSGNPEMVQCPICPKFVKLTEINEHLDSCVQ